MLSLHSLTPSPATRKKRRRIGRGESSGWGKTAGRGHKGQKARSGGSIPNWFEGGQMPLTRRVPKRGFTNINRISYTVVNVGDLEKMELGDSTEVTPELLVKIGKINARKPMLKILGQGEISKSLTVKAHAFSKSAQEKIEAAGGTVGVIHQ